jgi:hypothetical protein
MKTFLYRWRWGIAVLILSAYGLAGCGDDPPEQPDVYSPPAVGVATPWPACETTTYGSNILTQCPHPEEVGCKISGVRMSGCTFMGYKCVAKCTPVE